MLQKTARFLFAFIFSAASLIGQEMPADATAPAPEVAEVPESELIEMVGYLSALGAGIGSLKLDDSGVEAMADGFAAGLEPDVNPESFPQEVMEAAFAQAQARAQAAQAEAEALPEITADALNKIGVVMVFQSGLGELGFTAEDAALLRKGFVTGSKATEIDPAVEAKMPAFQTFIAPRVAKAQAAAQAAQAEAAEAQRVAAMADFKEAADTWSVKAPMTVVLETTQGNVEIELMPSVAPLAVANFVGHIESGYYNGLTFHRVITDFMIQGGDPMGTGVGGESIWGKPFPDEFSETVTFDTLGLLAMANAGPMTNGSQFFITTGKPEWLHKKHTIFGKVTSGYDVVKAIEGVETGAADKPVVAQEIVKAYVKQ